MIGINEYGDGMMSQIVEARTKGNDQYLWFPVCEMSAASQFMTELFANTYLHYKRTENYKVRGLI